MSKVAIKGAVNGKSLTGKGMAAILLIAVAGGLVSVFLVNNVPQVAEVTRSRGAKWYNPTTWF